MNIPPTSRFGSVYIAEIKSCVTLDRYIPERNAMLANKTMYIFKFFKATWLQKTFDFQDCLHHCCLLWSEVVIE